MEVTGGQTVGARSLGGVQVTTVADSTKYDSAPRQTVSTSERDSTPAISRESLPEAVVFPRDGTPLDRRPVQLRQARAAARYRRGGGRPGRRRPPRLTGLPAGGPPAAGGSESSSPKQAVAG